MNPYQAGDEPTDAELSAAIERGLADGSLIDATDWLAANATAETECGLPMSFTDQVNGHWHYRDGSCDHEPSDN
jgi:hypothetical protein